MDLTKYTELTGTTVSETDKQRYNAAIRKVNGVLETALGYSLIPSKNIDKEELGKVQFQGAYPYYPIDTSNLLDADEQSGEYRLFDYNEKDPYLITDPFRNVYHVKLVQSRNDDQFVTIMDLSNYAMKNARKFGKYIQRETAWFNWDWYGWLVQQLGNGSGLMVAVDGDWLNCNNMPDDLAYLWADMVSYYSNPDYSVSGSLKSESVNGHSWTRNNAGGGKGVDLSPEQSEGGLSVLAQYAGPNGKKATRIPTV